MLVRFSRTGVLALSGLVVVILLVGFRMSSQHEAASLCARSSSDGASLDLNFEWTIFITPQGFVGPADQQQRRAIKSWLRLTPKPRVVLAGQGEGYDVVAKELGLELSTHLDMNFAMLPLAGSLLHLASTFPTEIACIVNSDIILSQSFANALAKTRKNV